MNFNKVGGVVVALIIMFAAGYFIWGIGYQGEDYQTLQPGIIQDSKMVGVGQTFKVELPKAENPDQVWMLTRENPRLVLVDVNRSGRNEVWTFKALREGNAPLEFAWVLLDRGLWPSDERKIVEIEIR